MRCIDLEYANEHLIELVEQAVSGEEVVIMKNNQPLVKLIAATGLKRQRQFGSARGLITIADDFDAPLANFSDVLVTRS